MKNIVSTIALLSAFSAFAETSVVKVECTGTYYAQNDVNQRWDIIVKTNAAADKLEFTRSTHSDRGQSITLEHAVTASTASSISARRDNFADASLRELTLNLTNETLVDDKVYATLNTKVTSFNRRTGVEEVRETTQALACKVESN